MTRQLLSLFLATRSVLYPQISSSVLLVLSYLTKENLYYNIVIFWYGIAILVVVSLWFTFLIRALSIGIFIYLVYCTPYNCFNSIFLLPVGMVLVNLSFHLDDLVGSTITLYILPLAGAESAVALAVLVAFYPLRGTILTNNNISMSVVV